LRSPQNVKIMDLNRAAYRAWYYFRMGYATYLTFLLGFVSTLITVYYLAIKNLEPILEIFPHFESFAIVSTLVGVPLSICIGWIHLKRSKLYSSEVDVGVESNPYNYKMQPGYWKEVFTPLYLEVLVQLERMLQAQGLLSETDRQRTEELQKKLKTLIDGGYVGTPRRSM
jgi:hypothetical protein